MVRAARRNLAQQGICVARGPAPLRPGPAPASSAGRSACAPAGAARRGRRAGTGRPRGPRARGASTAQRRGAGAHRLHVAQSAAALLEVGLEQEGDLAEPLGALRGRPAASSGSRRLAVARQRGVRPLAQLGGQRRVAARRAAARAARTSPTGCRRRPRRASETVRTEWSRPMPVSQIGYQSRSARRLDVLAATVQQHQVEVAAGGRLAPAVGTDAGQRDVGLVARAAVQPVVGEDGQLGAQRCSARRRRAPAARRGPRRRSDGVGAPLAGTDADEVLDHDGPDLTVADLAGTGGVGDRRRRRPARPRRRRRPRGGPSARSRRRTPRPR